MQDLALSKHLMTLSIMIIVTVLLIVINTQHRTILIIYSYSKCIIVNIISCLISYFNFY